MVTLDVGPFSLGPYMEDNVYAQTKSKANCAHSTTARFSQAGSAPGEKHTNSFFEMHNQAIAASPSSYISLCRPCVVDANGVDR